MCSVLRAGISESERFLKGTSQIKTLSADDIEGMRVVSKVRAAVFPPEPDVFPPALILTGGPQLAREVLDIAAMMVKPGATTEEIDHAVHLVFTLSHSLAVSSRFVESRESRRGVCVFLLARRANLKGQTRLQSLVVLAEQTPFINN